MRVTDFIKGRCVYDEHGQSIWSSSDDHGMQIIADVRGWGAIQHLFPFTDEGQKEAGKFQDKVGQFIADAINEKIDRLILERKVDARNLLLTPNPETK